MNNDHKLIQPDWDKSWCVWNSTDLFSATSAFLYIECFCCVKWLLVFLKTGNIGPTQPSHNPYFPPFFFWLQLCFHCLWVEEKDMVWKCMSLLFPLEICSMKLPVSLTGQFWWCQFFLVFGKGAVTYLYAWKQIFLYFVYCIIKWNMRNCACVRVVLPFIIRFVFVKQNNCSQKKMFVPHQTSSLFDTLTVHSLGI